MPASQAIGGLALPSPQSTYEKVLPSPTATKAQIKKQPQQVLLSTQPTTNTQNNFSTQTPKINLDIFEVAYNTYLANKDINKAYEVALHVVSQVPDNLVWRERLANVATWNEKPEVALVQWYYLADNQTDNKDALKKGIKLAKQLHQYKYLILFYKLKLKKPLTQSEKNKIIGKLATAYTKYGEPENGTKLLREIPISQRSQENMKQLIDLYHALYEPENTLKAIDIYESKFPLNLSLTMLKATTQINLNKPNEAFETLNKFQNNQIKDAAFWKLFANISWKTNRVKEATLAYEQLFHLKKENSLYLERMIQYYEKTNPNKAFKYAVIGYEKYQSKSFFQQAIYIGIAEKKHIETQALIKSLPKKQRQTFSDIKGIEQSEIAFYQSKQDWQSVTRIYKKSIQKWPEDTQLKIDFLWFLLDRENVPQLKKYTEKWQSIAIKTPNFWNVYGSAFQKLKQESLALYFYQKLIEKDPNDYRWYMGASAALGGGDLTVAQTKKGALSLQYRKRAWQLLNNALDKSHKFTTPEEVNIYAYLAMQFSTADHSNDTMYDLKHYNQEQLNSTLMDMLFFKEYAQMAHLLLAYYRHTPLKIENWIHLRLALIDGDTVQMARLLKNHFKTLPERDRPIAAERAGQPRLAQQLAYESLEKKPYDNNLYEIHTNQIMTYPNKWQVAGGYRAFTGISGADISARYQQFIGYHSATLLKTTNWFPRVTDTSDIAKAPKVVHTSTVTIKRYLQGGRLSASLGVMHAFRTTPMALINYEHIVTHQINFFIDGGYGQPATDSVPLIIIGMRNFFDTRARFALTPRDQLNLLFGYNRFDAQDYSYLGDSIKSEISFSHQFRLSYPDPSFTFAVVNNINHANPQLSSFALSVAPVGADLPSFYIPGNSTSFNIIFNLGMKYLEDYTHRWRPFTSLSASYNTLFGLGYGLTAGIAGSLIGRDHLAIYTEFFNNAQQSGGEPTLYAGSKYTYYF